MKREKYIELRAEMSHKSISELVKLLSSEELQTRFFAEMCLRDATGV